MSGQSFLVSRAWLLMLLEASERNGVTPVHMENLHRYIFLANALSPVCKLHMPESYTLKHMRGPYFPRAQWDIGRLILQGFVEAKNFRPFSDEDGFWLAAEFRITRLGIDLVKKISQHSYLIEQLNYLREFMSACSLVPMDKINAVAQIDFHYSPVSEGERVSFSEVEGNLSQSAVVLMFPEDRLYTPTEGVHRYIDYLDKVVSYG